MRAFPRWQRLSRRRKKIVARGYSDRIGLKGQRLPAKQWAGLWLAWKRPLPEWKAPLLDLVAPWQEANEIRFRTFNGAGILHRRTHLLITSITFA